ncbi:hypothetical protein A2U01_0058832, partial [Trifolium medium]|nr:hypothetical protein [Trifolium medium]
ELDGRVKARESDGKPEGCSLKPEKASN